MEYELEKWDHFISMTLQPSNLANFLVNDESLQLLADQSETKRDAVRQQMIQVVFSLSKEKATELFVQQHQAVMIRLLDTVYGYEKLKGLQAPVKKMYYKINEHLNFVLTFIENYFSKYFNLDERVPTLYLENFAKEICKDIELCKASLKQAGIKDDKLIAIILDIFEDICGEHTQLYTYRDLRYRKELLDNLSTLGTTHKQGCIYAAVSELLIHANFNATPFFNYFIAIIHEEIKQFATTGEKMEKLAVHAKEIAQIQLRPNFVLNQGSPNVKAMFSEAIDKEISYLRSISATPDGYISRNNSSTHPSPAIVSEPASAYEQTKQQVFLPFKGAEIYLLHKSFIDAGGAPGEIYKTLLEKTATHLANKTVKGFSAESICKYSDKVTPEVKEDVKRFLQKMIRNIDSYD